MRVASGQNARQTARHRWWQNLVLLTRYEMDVRQLMTRGIDEDFTKFISLYYLFIFFIFKIIFFDIFK
jgi:hypothetical protein